MDWVVVESAALKAEEAEGQHGRRVVRVLFSGAVAIPDLWHGLFGNAPVEFGPEGFVMSDGEVITL